MTWSASTRFHSPRWANGWSFPRLPWTTGSTRSPWRISETIFRTWASRVARPADPCESAVCSGPLLSFSRWLPSRRSACYSRARGQPSPLLNDPWPHFPRRNGRMSGLQEFLTPFSHLIFANRDKVIVLLAALLAWFTIQLLITRWRNERLERDLSAAKTGGSAPSGRRYATSAPVEEAHAEGGALPPVKGGRTYARNLGTALQKAGMSGPAIYSPPTPAGWTPNTNPQAGPPQPQPGMAPPYATPNAPWAVPTQPPPAPWGFPTAGRPMPGPQPNQAPFYQPQPPPSQPMGSPQSPPPVPALYGPPPPFGQPAYPAASSGPAAPAPFSAPPGIPTMPGAMPPFGSSAGVEPTSGEPPSQDAGRRGKPKRRRFNFNVLQNLEKLVQQKVQPAPATGWTPPAPASGV